MGLQECPKDMEYLKELEFPKDIKDPWEVECQYLLV